MLTSTPNQNPTKADWSPSRDAFLVQQLTEQQNAGKRSESGWGKESWKIITSEFNDKFGLKNTPQQLKSRFAQLRKQYFILKRLLNYGDFDWDPETHVLLANDDVWENYLKDNPEARRFRKINWPIYKELSVICEGFATRGCGHSTVIHFESNKEGMSTNESLSTPFVSTSISPEVDGNNHTHINSDDDDLRDSQKTRKRYIRSTSTSHQRKYKVCAPNHISSDVLMQLVPPQERICGSAETSGCKEIMPKNFTYAESLDELQQLEGFTEDELVTAVAILMDENNRIAFMKLRGSLRLAWLRSELNHH